MDWQRKSDAVRKARARRVQEWERHHKDEGDRKANHKLRRKKKCVKYSEHCMKGDRWYRPMRTHSEPAILQCNDYNVDRIKQRRCFSMELEINQGN